MQTKSSTGQSADGGDCSVIAPTSLAQPESPPHAMLATKIMARKRFREFSKLPVITCYCTFVSERIYRNVSAAFADATMARFLLLYGNQNPGDLRLENGAPKQPWGSCSRSIFVKANNGGHSLPSSLLYLRPGHRTRLGTRQGYHRCIVRYHRIQALVGFLRRRRRSRSQTSPALIAQR